MVFIAFVTRCHSVAFRFLTSRRTRAAFCARQGQLGQLVPQQGMAGEAAAPTAARRTHPTFFMGRRSALILSYAGELVPRTPSKIARRVHVINAFLTQCSLFVLLSVSILGESSLVVFARFSQGIKLRPGFLTCCRRAASRHVYGEGGLQRGSPSGKSYRDARPRQSAESFQSTLARKTKGLWGPIAPRVGARRHRNLYRLL